MTQNKRIILNILATYGRSVYAMVCGIFTSRWVLMALGKVDYGLYGVVGGLIAFIAFFNLLLASSLARFYAVSVGKASVAQDSEQGIEICREWFSIAVMVHTIVPVVLVVVGYPIGMWAVENWLTIPPDRVQACAWVFRLMCLSCLIGMMNVPFQAMYTAKQYIAELTIYSFATTTLNLCFFYYMVSHPGVWLTKYALWMCLIGIVPQIIIMLRACWVFKECRFRFAYCRKWSHIKELMNFAGWQAFGNLGGLLRGQGIAILVNKYFGPSVNASMAIANTVSSQTNTLSAAMQGAFAPAITTAYGAGQLDYMRAMALRACKFGLVLSLLFVIPLSLELDYVIRLWLKTPPDFVNGLCLCMLLMLIIDKSSVGHMIAVNASGKIARYQAVLGGSLILTLPIAWLFVELGLGVYSIVWAMILTMILCALGRVWFARTIVGMSAKAWLGRVIFPVSFAICASGGLGFCVRFTMPEGIGRVGLTTIACLVAFIPSVWFFVFDKDEKAFVAQKLKRILRRA
ncbi:MAG: hypothetical protein MJ109_00460 [Kiritimatiellae bacterium]|nr:hypothetical protein [Kiritimatiellia bacterium]